MVVATNMVMGGASAISTGRVRNAKLTIALQVPLIYAMVMDRAIIMGTARVSLDGVMGQEASVVIACHIIIHCLQRTISR
jgi:hypothetical protein